MSTLRASTPAVNGNTGSATTILVTAGAAVSVGDRLVVCAGASGVAISTVADSLGNNYTPNVVDGGHTGVGTIELWNVVSGFAGTPVGTVTYTVAATFRFVHFAAFLPGAGGSFPNATADKTGDSQDVGTAANAITSPDV